MATHQQYIELLCSLPHLANPFRYKRPAITRVQLQKRMTMLDQQDLHWLQKLNEAFYWGGITLHEDEVSLINKANRFLAGIPYRDIQEWLEWRMDVRTVVAAIRRRKQGEDAPAIRDNWGYGRYVRQIVNNWSSPCFKLEYHFPWLPDVVDGIETGQSFKVEQILLNAVWHYYAMQKPETPYGFSAVVLYVAKWDLVDRWCKYNADRAGEHFDELVNHSLKKSMRTLKDMA